jgi:hypothetical protein
MQLQKINAAKKAQLLAPHLTISTLIGVVPDLLDISSHTQRLKLDFDRLRCVSFV